MRELSTHTENGVTWTVGQTVRYEHTRTDVDHGLTGRVTSITAEDFDGTEEVTLWVTWHGSSGADAHGAYDIEPA